MLLAIYDISGELKKYKKQIILKSRSISLNIKDIGVKFKYTFVQK